MYLKKYVVLHKNEHDSDNNSLAKSMYRIVKDDHVTFLSIITSLCFSKDGTGADHINRILNRILNGSIGQLATASILFVMNTATLAPFLFWKIFQARFISTARVSVTSF